MRYVRFAAIVLALTWQASSASAETLTLKCSFVGLVPQEITYNVNRDTKEVQVIGEFGTHKGMLLNKTEGFFYILEPNLGASVATIIYSMSGETPVGIRSTLGKLNEDQFQGIPGDLKISSEKLRFMAVSVKGRCQNATQTTDEVMKSALGEVAEELQECSVYFGVVSRCVKPQRPGVAVTYGHAADKVGELAKSSSRAAGMSHEAFHARDAYYTKAMMEAMSGNCSNIQVLLNKYLSFCQQLEQDADPRLKAWIACLRAGQQTCGGPGLP
jgi:hypothetical protein